MDGPWETSIKELTSRLEISEVLASDLLELLSVGDRIRYGIEGNGRVWVERLKEL